MKKDFYVASIFALSVIGICAEGSFEGEFSIPLKRQIVEYSSEEQDRLHALHIQVKDILRKAFNDIDEILKENADFINAMKAGENEPVRVSMKIVQE